MCIRCTHNLSLREYQRHHDRIIKKVGWACQVVEPAKFAPGWIYTIGLEAHGHPELIMIGGPPRTAYRTLNEISEKLVRESRDPLKPGTIMNHSCGVAARVAYLEVDEDIIEAGEWFNMATYRRGGTTGFTAIQAVWSDPFGQLPTETTPAQPLLGTPWWIDTNAN